MINGIQICQCCCQFYTSGTHTREAYSSLLSRFSGAGSKIPVLSNDLYRDEWIAMGKILVRGYADTGYFPIQIAESVMMQVYDRQEPDDEVLINSLLKVMSVVDQDLVSKIKGGEETEESDDDDDEMMDEFVATYGLSAMPTKDTIDGVLLQVARRLLVQEPHFVIDCWRTLASSWGAGPAVNVREIYVNAQPTTVKVLKLFRFGELENLNTTEKNSVKWLKKFTKELSSEKLKRFLQWMTGSDVILPEVTIRVMFHSHVNQGQDLGRVPIARTCGPCLDLPNSYKNANELSGDLHSILNGHSSDWGFDIV